MAPALANRSQDPHHRRHTRDPILHAADVAADRLRVDCGADITREPRDGGVQLYVRHGDGVDDRNRGYHGGGHARFGHIHGE